MSSVSSAQTVSIHAPLHREERRGIPRAWAMPPGRFQSTPLSIERSDRWSDELDAPMKPFQSTPLSIERSDTRWVGYVPPRHWFQSTPLSIERSDARQLRSQYTASQFQSTPLSIERSDQGLPVGLGAVEVSIHAPLHREERPR